MRDHNTIISKLGQRVREIDQLISEIRILVLNNLSTPQNQCEIDMDKLIIMGHGFGATTAIVTA
jgi:predicted dienelactone hydrolase